MENKYLILKKIPFLFFLVITLILFIIDSNNFFVLLIITILSLIPVGLQISGKNKFSISKELQATMDAFYFSSFFLFFGYFFATVYHSNSKPDFFTNPFSLAVIFAIYFTMMAGLFAYWAISKSNLADNYYKTIKSNENIAIKDFLTIAKEKDANVLAVAGNLKSLNSNEGIKLLKEFLSNNSSNKLELFIPPDAEPILKELKNKFADIELAKRVEINIVEPFVFLQGIVFAGQRIKDEMKPLTKGYYLYKPIIQEGDTFSKGGIFVDVSYDTDESDYYSIAIGAYYNHLKNKEYPINGYKFIPGIFNAEQQKFHNHIKKTITLDKV